ncbi:transglutaminase-like domain-containing protein [Ovoidimarina sediminis]|uniref:transglutaminase-like domain-containing protein n=1 Tax=Ovoidimarina sediminis TaxID=3079856 RepID=UPI00290EE50D|nr:transglutaminase family protein [Rhodophyticola sp. MJ-SS7]MDU8946699.1 transglutaminase family protein [Rhodophyticola sp. MJ-SS7]
MLIRFGFEIEIETAEPVPMLLALSTRPELADDIVFEREIQFSDELPTNTYLDRFGNRITRLVAPGGQLAIRSDGLIDANDAFDFQDLSARQIPIPDLPDEVLQFLVASRYCDSDNLINDAWQLFKEVPEGGRRVQAITDYVHANVTFGYQFGRANKTASETFREKSGVCRDFAHLAISLCRAMNIPARYASGYLGDIGVPYSGPGDFSAWFEVYLGDQWYTFDARHNQPRKGRIVMVRGADAADVAMITSFGEHDLKYFAVWTDEIGVNQGASELHRLMQSRPKAEPLVFPSSARVA